MLLAIPQYQVLNHVRHAAVLSARSSLQGGLNLRGHPKVQRLGLLLHGIHVNSTCRVCTEVWWTKCCNLRYIEVVPMFGCANRLNRLLRREVVDPIHPKHLAIILFIYTYFTRQRRTTDSCMDATLYRILSRCLRDEFTHRYQFRNPISWRPNKGQLFVFMRQGSSCLKLKT